MSKPRQAKWDWPSHMSRMDELYRKGISIPDIHKLIQCEGFTPSQRAVYDRFHYEGYPTDQAGRAKLLRAGLPSIAEKGGPVTIKYETVQAEEKAGRAKLLRAGLSSIAEKGGPVKIKCEPVQAEEKGVLVQQQAGILRSIAQLQTAPPSNIGTPSNLDTPTIPTLGHEFDSFGINSPATMSTPAATEVLHNLEFVSAAGQGHNHRPIDAGVVVVPPGSEAHKQVASWDQQSGDLSPDKPQEHKRRNDSRKNERDRKIINNLQRLGILDDAKFNHRRKVVRRPTIEAEIKAVYHPRPPEPSLYPDGIDSLAHVTNDPPRTNTPLYKVRSLFRPKFNQLQVPEKRYSQSTLDSGYYSGRASLSTLPMILSPHPDSLKEFQGLYRVACHTLHEPKLKYLDQFRDVQTCDTCGYSSIHNLAWSARHLKLEVFQTELKLENTYDFGAIDAAGNTALHYAAASGSGLPYLKALIDVGVNPYHQNTANENFLHWLRPYKPSLQENMLLAMQNGIDVDSARIEKHGFDCFSLDLIALLKLTLPGPVFGQRDNNGRTVLHALAGQIIEPELRAEVFKFFSGAGYPATSLDRFGKTAKDVIPVDYRFTESTIDLATFETTIPAEEDEIKPHPCGVDWQVEYQKQVDAEVTIRIAYENNTRHVDGKTGDSVLNALARVNPQMYDVLLHLQHFVQNGADVNLHNRDGNHPLASFTSERPFENETGATKAMYLDALLWKDHKFRIRTDINVNMKNRAGETALHNAAVRARLDSVRSLIEAEANVNARIDSDGERLSILRATRNARDEAVEHNDECQVYMFKEVISRLEHAGAVLDPTSLQERG